MKILVHFANGFEEIEALAPVDIFRRAGYNVTMVSVTGKKEVTSSRNVTIIADALIEDVDYSDANLIVLPGGAPGTQNLDKSELLKKKIIEHNNNGKLLGAICAAPTILGKMGLLKGLKATCYPGGENDLLGAIVQNERLVYDRNIVTAKGAGVSLDFGFKLVEILDSKEKAEEIRKKMIA